MCEKSLNLLNKYLENLLIIMKMGSILSSFKSIILLTLVLNLNLVEISFGFNLETRLPLIKEGPRNSYFGYSVAQHLIVDETTQKTSQAVMLVGAPRAQSGQPQTNHSGVVFKCSLTTFKKDCLPITIDQDNNPPDDSINKNDQWLGVTVKSQGPGGYVMACAHRYVLKGPDFQWGQGICYSLSQYLDFRRAWEPCYNRPVNKAHEQFGYCQAGTSGEITEDFDIVIGAPGPYTWRGTVFSNSVRYRIRDDKTWYLGPVLESESPVDKYSYLGMSVTSGKFFDSTTSYAGGAPRANGTGQVVFFSKHKGESTFDVNLILNGEQFASSYGYSMTSLDCNGDGLLDLVVGAPFYYSRSEGGAVYLYLNSNGRFSKPSTRLTGKPESRFGFALANAGDLNKDGNQDLAIGAPYEDNGVIYIHSGTSNGVKETPSQIIKASELPYEFRNIKTFGYSLSGTHDLDQNGYPDLLVGAYESDTIILFRARPIIDIVTSVTGKLTQINPNEKGCAEDQSAQLVCFSFNACFKFNTTLRSASASFPGLRYRIEAETYTGIRQIFILIIIWFPFIYFLNHIQVKSTIASSLDQLIIRILQI
jgi:integrin alpha 7